MTAEDKYRQAGVDIEKGNEFVKMIAPLVSSTHNSSVLGKLGGFSGLMALNIEHIKQPVLVSSTDGVGTKLKIAFMMDKHDTVGIDLVAMVVNDIIVTGAKPLFLLDYFSTGKLEPEKAAQVVAGIVEGCKQAGCALLGGETAEMPGFYPPGEYDLAAFGVGVVDREKIIDNSQVKKGHILVGLASSGLHSNGYSLVRRIVFEELKLNPDAMVEGLERSIGQEILEPTRIYVEPVLNLMRDFELSSLAHITGGGILENLPRALPSYCRALVRKNSWPILPIFRFLRLAGGLEEQEMYRTFNSGLGMVLVVPPDQVQDIMDRLNALQQPAYVIGEVLARQEDEPQVEFI